MAWSDPYTSGEGPPYKAVLQFDELELLLKYIPANVLRLCDYFPVMPYSQTESYGLIRQHCSLSLPWRQPSCDEISLPPLLWYSAKVMF